MAEPMTGGDSEALQQIRTHEAVCTERYQHLEKTLNSIDGRLARLESDQKTTAAKQEARQEKSEMLLRDEMHASDKAIRTDVDDHEKRISTIEKAVAKYGGGLAVILFLATLGGSILGGYLK